MWRNVTADKLKEVAEISGILEAPTDITDQRLQQKYEQLIPHPDAIPPHRIQHIHCFLT